MTYFVTFFIFSKKIFLNKFLNLINLLSMSWVLAFQKEVPKLILKKIFPKYPTFKYLTFKDSNLLKFSVFMI